MKYFALLTKLGENLLAQATALGTKIELTHMAVGDGGGSLPTPDTNQTKLIKEQRRAAINTLFIDEQNKNQIIAEQIIPEKDGGWWIREIGLFDKDGNLIAVANCPETYKPQLVEGSGRTQSIRMVLIVSNAESVTLKIDPSVVLATRDYVNDSVKKGIEEHEKSRKHPDASTTAKGFVQLADSLSDDNTKAITPKLATEINQRATNAQTTANAANTNATNANNNANGRVPSTRKVNNKALSADINLTASDVGAYGKDESDTRFQPKGNYAPSGNYQPAGDYATNASVDSKLDNKVSKSSIAQGPGTSITNVISQDGVTKFFLKKGEFGWGGLGQSLSLQGWTSIKALIAENASRIYNSKTANELNGNSAYVPMFLMQTGNVWANIAINHINGIMTVGAGYDDVKTVSTVYSTANTSTDRNGYLRTSSTTAEIQAVPIGSSIIWNSTAPIPDNFWPNEGRSFSEAEYPELAKIYPTLKLPDDRGYAIRIADNGRGIDAGRTVGTYQQDAVQKMTGTLQINGVENASGAGAFSARQTAEFTGGHYQSSGSLEGRAYIDIDSSRVVRSADETRMKNVAKILITRVK